MASSEAAPGAITGRPRSRPEPHPRLRWLIEHRAQLLAGVARTYQTCKSDLIDLLDDIATNSDATASYNAASASCANADTQLNAYLHGF